MCEKISKVEIFRWEEMPLWRDFVLYKLRAAQSSNNSTLHLFINSFNRYLLSALCFLIYRRYTLYVHVAPVLVGKVKINNECIKTKPTNTNYL